MSRFSLTARLILLALLASLALLLLLPVSIGGYNLLNDQYNRLAEVEMPFAQQLLEVRAAVSIAEIRLERSALVVQSNRPLATVGALASVEQATSLMRSARELALRSALTQLDLDGRIGQIDTDLSRMRTLVESGETALTNQDLNAFATLRPQISDQADLVRRRLNDLYVDHQQQVAEIAPQIASQHRGRLFIVISAALAISALLFSLAWVVAQSIVRPLKTLQNAFASYKFGAAPALLPVANGPEINQLSAAASGLFAAMHQESDQVERQVQDRTVVLGQRMLQLQVAAEVARDAASVSETDSLLARAVNLVQVRFDLYFVAIFLMDEQERFAILRSGTGEAGRIMRERGFRLPVGETSLVGYTCQNGLPRIVNDIESDFVYYKEPLLPLTRSEAVLPLKVGARVIGALDVQSIRIEAFPSEDIPVLQILADQLAVAIENARLLSALKETAQQTQTLYQRYAGQAWMGNSAAGLSRSGFEFDLMQVSPLVQETVEALHLTAENLASLRSGQPLQLERPASADSPAHPVVLAPLVLYNQLVGLVGLEDTDPDRVWSDDEFSVLKALAGQISLALDNARLLEDSQRRSAQLRLLQQVAAAATGQTDLRQLLDHVCQALRSGLELDLCRALLIEQTLGGTPGQGGFKFAEPIVVERQPGLAAESGEADFAALTAALLAPGSALDAARGGQRVAPLLAGQSQVVASVGPSGALFVPVLSRGQLVAVLILQRLSDQTFGADEVDLLNQVSLQLGSAVEVALSFQETTQRAERERLIGDVTRRIRATLDVDAILRSAAQEIRSIFDLPGVTIRLNPESSLNAVAAPAVESGAEGTPPINPPNPGTGPLGAGSAKG